MTMSTQRLMQVMTTKVTITIATLMTMKGAHIIMRQNATRTTMRGILMMLTITKAIATALMQQTLTKNMLMSRV